MNENEYQLKFNNLYKKQKNPIENKNTTNNSTLNTIQQSTLNTNPLWSFTVNDSTYYQKKTEVKEKIIDIIQEKLNENNVPDLCSEQKADLILKLSQVIKNLSD